MRIDFVRFAPHEMDQLVAFLTGEPWPFHAGAPDAGQIRRRAAEGRYDDADERTYWLLADGERAGLVRLQDLGDDTPLFDVRIRQAYRGRGLGTAAVTWLTRYLFTELSPIRRIEGTTRQDNHAMRAVFRRCGYVKEAHYRQAWPGIDGHIYDSVGYAVLRADWETGTVTPVDWDDA